MRKLVLVSSGPPLVIRAPDVLCAWSRNRESVYRGLEIATANALAVAYDKVYLLAHDGQGHAATYRGQLAKNVHVLFKPRGMPSSIHRIVGPLIFRRYISDASVCRASELRGSLTAIVTKLLYGTRVILRQGYQVSRLTREVLSRTGSRRPFRARVFLVLATLLELMTNHVANAITVSSSAGGDYVIRRYGVDSRRVFVLPNWVDVTIFKPSPYITKERGRVIFVGKAVTEATKFFFEDKEESKKMLSKWLQENDQESLEQHYQDWSSVALRIPETSVDQVRNILETIAPFTPKAVNADPRIFVDSSIIEELESEGFFRSIWG